MADGFRVDLGALEDAAAGINSVLAQLQAMNVGDIDGRKHDYGHDHLGGTVSDFCERWELGVENLAKGAQVVAERLNKNVQAYLALDSTLKGHMDGTLTRTSGDDPGVH